MFMTEADKGKMLDLDVVVQVAYKHADALGCQPESGHQRDLENYPDDILTISYKVQV